MFNPSMNTVSNNTVANNQTAQVAQPAPRRQATMPGIKRSWSLVSFRNMFTKMQYCPDMVNKTTGEVFDSLAFTDADGDITFVGFSSKMGSLTPAEIKQNKDSLQVCQLESGYFTLCKQGENSWQDIDL